MKKNVLVYCERNKNIAINFNKYNKVFLVSPDLELYNFQKKYSNVIFILFDSDHLIFTTETWDMINKLNHVIQRLNLIKPSYLYEAGYLIEGGFTQIVADTLYAINIFNEIIKNKKIDMFVCDKRYTAEALALQCIAYTKKKKFLICLYVLAVFSKLNQR